MYVLSFSFSFSFSAVAVAVATRSLRSLRSVVLAAKYTVTGGKTVKIKKIVGHPGYSEKKFINDIAVGIELDRRALAPRTPRLVAHAHSRSLALRPFARSSS